MENNRAGELAPKASWLHTVVHRRAELLTSLPDSYLKTVVPAPFTYQSARTFNISSVVMIPTTSSFSVTKSLWIRPAIMVLAIL